MNTEGRATGGRMPSPRAATSRIMRSRSQTVATKLQDSADGSTGWADVSAAAATDLTADDTEDEVDIDLSGAKRYVRAVTTVSFTAGTTPSIPVAATLVLAGKDELPA
jgi:hypothetical protein